MLIINNSGCSRPAEFDSGVDGDQDETYNCENADDYFEYGDGNLANSRTYVRLHYSNYIIYVDISGDKLLLNANN
jgi:hypothetical protein